MKSVYLGYIDAGTIDKFSVGVKTFVIGVNGRLSSLDKLQTLHGEQLVIERLPETVNARYTNEEESERKRHILQPAFITRKV